MFAYENSANFEAVIAKIRNYCKFPIEGEIRPWDKGTFIVRRADGGGVHIFDDQGAPSMFLDNRSEGFLEIEKKIQAEDQKKTGVKMKKSVSLQKQA